MYAIKLIQYFLINYCVVEARALSPPTTLDGLLSKILTIQVIHDSLMAG